MGFGKVIGVTIMGDDFYVLLLTALVLVFVYGWIYDWLDVL